LERKRVLLLNPTPILADSKSLNQAKEKMNKIFEEAAWAKNVILVFDNFDQFVSSKNNRIDLTAEIVNAIERKKLMIIGLVTNDNYQKYILPNPKVLENLEKIDVSQPTKEEALIIIEDILPNFEAKTGVTASYPALKEIINLSEKWVTDIPFPEKAIDLLDSCLIYVRNNVDEKILKPKHVRQVLSDKTKIPLKSLTAEEKEKLSNIEDKLHQRIVDQNQAVNEIAVALRRRKTGIAEDKKPIGSFLFLGPTGVGKTETAKALAEFLFNNEENMIRLDMSTYQGSNGIEKLIGSFEREEPGILTSAVRQNPHAVLLLDEIEKAPQQILNLFLTAIDEGYITDAFNKRVSFRHLMVIGTSNAGAEFIRQQINQGVNPEKLSGQLVDHILRQGVFSPEFINRFDAVVVYKPLSHEDLVKIAKLMLNRLNQRLAKKELKLEINDQLINKVAELGYDPVFGARPMKRVIAEQIEDKIAQKILAGQAKKGETIKITL
jgi:ATP-dependent Clp protease ATP-binding subunit ClpC